MVALDPQGYTVSMGASVPAEQGDTLVTSIDANVQKLAEKYSGSIDVVKVDVDANPGLSRAFNVLSIPTIAFFRPGKQPMAIVGAWT